MASKDLLTNRLKEMNKNKEAMKKEKPNVVENIAKGTSETEEKPDFMKMAEVLEEKKQKEPSKLENAVKDTIYIREDLYKAMQSLCHKQGDKRKLVNQAYEEFLTKKYKELRKEIHIDE